MNRGSIPSNGNLPREERQVKEVRDRLGDARGCTLKKKGLKPSEPDGFKGSSLSSFSTSTQLCSGAGEKEGGASGLSH
jgi:hypothetical protein